MSILVHCHSQCFSNKSPILGTDTSPDRQNRENRDVEVSKKVQNIAKKHFLKNIFSCHSFGSRCFVSRIVFGCGGAGDSRTSRVFEKSMQIHDLGLHFAACASRSCPNNNTENKILFRLCNSCWAGRWVNRLDSCSTRRGNVLMITVHSIFPIFRFQKFFLNDFRKCLSFSMIF